MTTFSRTASALVVLLLAAGCAERPYVIEEPATLAGASPTEEPWTAPSPPAPEASPSPEGAATEGDYMAIDPKVLAKCVEEKALARACPTEVPRLERSGFTRSGTIVPMKDVIAFNYESSAPYPGLTERNAPPRFAHIVVESGDIARLLGGFEWPEPAEGRLDSPPPPKRTLPLWVGRRTWGGVPGELALAPPYPNGGLNGDHLMFRWSADGRDFILSLHAWDDLKETERALEHMFLSTAYGRKG